MIVKVMKDIKGLEVFLLFLRMVYDDVMNNYGFDKFDIRFDMFL